MSHKPKQKPPNTLYVPDEPTVGLHLANVEKLIHEPPRLMDRGHSVLAIEHDLDLILEADSVIDLGPEGGIDGNSVVAAGTPELPVARRTPTSRAVALVLTRWHLVGRSYARGMLRGMHNVPQWMLVFR